MSPRRKRIPDSEIVLAAARIVAERGAAQTRLADVAAATGFAPATLVQRFGSRENLLNAVANAQIASVAAAFSLGLNPVSASGAEHLDRITVALQRLHADGHLSFLLTHGDSARSYSIELRKHIAFALAAAREAGELAPCEVATQARHIQIAYYGLTAAALLERDESVMTALESLVPQVLADFL